MIFLYCLLGMLEQKINNIFHRIKSCDGNNRRGMAVVWWCRQQQCGNSGSFGGVMIEEIIGVSGGGVGSTINK